MEHKLKLIKIIFLSFTAVFYSNANVVFAKKSPM